MPERQPRIVIPKTIEGLLKLGVKINAKHQADGATSPLSVQQDFNWTTHGPKLAQALSFHNKAEDFRRQAEAATEQRDLLMGDINGTVKSSRDILKGTFRKQLRKLGEWGFEVNDAQTGGGDDGAGIPQ